MANTIESTDWASLRQACGTCEHIPAALNAICSPDERVREEAYWKIDNHVILQGDLYEGAPYVARALVELLDHRVSEKDRLYNLLVELANGYAPATMQVVVDGQRVPVKYATVQCILPGLAHYLEDLSAESTIIRKRAAELLLALVDEIDLDAHTIIPIAQAESDEDVRALLEELADMLRKKSSGT